MMKRRIGVLLVDDHEVIRQGLRRILESEDMYIVGDFANAEEAFARMAELSPEVVLMDDQMPGVNGIEATRHLKKSGASCKADVIILAESFDYAIAAMEAGAVGYLLKDTSGAELAEAIRQVSLNQKTAKDSDSVLEETVDLVLPPSTEPAKTLKFIDQVEKRLEASVMQTVGSPDRGSVITIALDADTVRDLLGRLKEIPDVEKVEEMPVAKRGLHDSVQKMRNWPGQGNSCRERIAVTLN